jgi:hypothetical protein
MAAAGTSGTAGAPAGTGGANTTGAAGEAASGGCACAIDASTGRASLGSVLAMAGALSLLLAGRRRRRAVARR